ncbi:MAG: hypothetical protein LBB15_01980 [Puniceicoccales bacterium]|nr:hypothetical protein [Puniceicoccales bacterium]
MKFLRVVRLRYKLSAFVVLLFMPTSCLIYCVIHSYRQSQLISLRNKQVLEQEMWLRCKEEIFRKFDEACDKLKSGKNFGNFLMDFVEKAASDCDCQYELLAEYSHRAEGVLIASVSAALHNITMAKFVHFSNTIAANGARMNRASFVGNKDGNLDVKCLIEAASLDE